MIELINEELFIIQQYALSGEEEKLRNNLEIKELIEKNDIRYVEDFIEEDLDFTIVSSSLEAPSFSQVRYNYNSKSYKDIVEEKIVHDLDLYQDAYCIIGIDLFSKHWDLLFDTLYSFYHKNNLDSLFLEDMSRLNRFAVSLALLKTQILDISCYLDGIGYLESEYLKEKDILEIKDKLNKEIAVKKIISFPSSKKRVKVDKQNKLML